MEPLACLSPFAIVSWIRSPTSFLVFYASLVTSKISQIRELSVNRKYLQASNSAGLTQENPALDPLAVPHLHNQLYVRKIAH